MCNDNDIELTNARFSVTNEKGFTFIEVLYASAILVVALLAILGANTYIRRANQATYERTVATQEAHSVLEQMRDMANLLQPNTFPRNVTNTWQGRPTQIGNAYLPNGSYTVAFIDPNADPLDAIVTVTWRELGVRNASVQLRSLLTRRN